MSNIIERVDYFSCGYCKNKLGVMFKNSKNEKKLSGIINFPAGVFLIKHREIGYILYDTGYGIDILKNNFKYFLYRAPNPIILKKEDLISEQLLKRGINQNEIRYVILSHLHPDHIGDVKKFQNAKIIITEDCYENYKNSRLKDLIFKEFLPKYFEERVEIIKKYKKLKDFPVKVKDLFGDGSLYLASINGHSRGQGCLFVKEKNLFIAADVCWGVDLMKYTERMRTLPKLVQDNFKDYERGIDILENIQKEKIDVIVSHDPEERIKKILYEENN